MKFKVFAALAALVCSVLTATTASAEFSRKTITTRMGDFTVCVELVRFAPCGIEPDAPFEWQKVSQVAYQRHTIRTPQGGIVRVHALEGVAVINGNFFVTTYSDGLLEYDFPTDDFQGVYSSSEFRIKAPTEKAPGPYMRLTTVGERGMFRGLLLQTSYDTWREFPYGGFNRGVPVSIETMADGRLKLIPDEQAPAYERTPFYFNKETGLFSEE